MTVRDSPLPLILPMAISKLTPDTGGGVVGAEAAVVAGGVVGGWVVCGVEDDGPGAGEGVGDGDGDDG